jgi:hypothetical protein
MSFIRKLHQLTQITWSLDVECSRQPVAILDALPPSLADSAMADELRAICDLDLSELQGIEPPRGFGRD